MRSLGVEGRRAWKKRPSQLKGSRSLSPGGRHLTTGNRLRWSGR